MDGCEGLVEEMIEEGTSAMRLVMPDSLYMSAKHAAVDSRMSASEWIREAIRAKLGKPEGDERLGRVMGAWEAMGWADRDALLRVARALAGFTNDGSSDNEQRKLAAELLWYAVRPEGMAAAQRSAADVLARCADALDGSDAMLAQDAREKSLALLNQIEAIQNICDEFGESIREAAEE